MTQIAESIALIIAAVSLLCLAVSLVILILKEVKDE